MKSILALLVAFLLFSCEKNSNQSIPVCDNSNTEFNQIYTNFLSTSGSEELISMDAVTHEYTFFVSNSKRICSIGYQSAHTVSTTPYLIEIVNNVTGAVLYSGSHVFSSTNTSYISFSTPINLQANISYSIRRIQNDWGTNIVNTIGRVSTSDYAVGVHTSLLPMTSGDLTITSASFDVTGTQNILYMLPYIDIVFES